MTHSLPVEYPPVAGRRTGKDYQKTVFGILLLILIVLTVPLVYQLIISARGRPVCQPCLSLECLSLSQLFLAAQVPSMDPCEDFFTYTCGNWKRSGTSSSDHANTTFTRLLHDNMAVLRSLLDEKQSVNEDIALKHARTFYNSCIDIRSLDRLGTQPLLDIIEQVGGWPGSEQWNTTDFNETLQTLMSKFHTFPFFTIYLESTPWDSKTNYIQIDHAEFEAVPEVEYGSPTDNRQERHENIKYWKQIEGLLFGITSSQLIEGIVHFMSKLRNMVTPFPERIQKHRLFQRTTVQELQAAAPSTDWLACLRVTFPALNVTLSQPIIVHDMDYLVKMSCVVSQVRDGALLQGHMVLCLIHTWLPFLDERFLSLGEKWPKKDLHHIWVAPRWERCLYQTNHFFEPILSVMFTQRAVSDGTERMALDLYESIKSALHEAVGNVEWIPEEKRKEAQQKLQDIQIQLGIPSEYMKTKDTHSQLALEEGHFLWNALQLHSISRGSAPAWHIPPWSVYPYYSQRQNMLVIPVGVLRPPIFHPNYPGAVNFGGLGVILAHELIHSLLEYVLPVLWGDVDGEDQQIVCLQEQYDNYSMHNMSVNGSKTLLENMADGGGLHIAQHAFERWTQNLDLQTSLPGLSLTQNQLFYFSFAQMMCGRSLTEDEWKRHLTGNPHSPQNLRINGALSNSLEFSPTFHCKENSSMNPQLKCKIWL